MTLYAIPDGGVPPLELEIRPVTDAAASATGDSSTDSATAHCGRGSFRRTLLGPDDRLVVCALERADDVAITGLPRPRGGNPD